MDNKILRDHVIYKQTAWGGGLQRKSTRHDFLDVREAIFGIL